MVRVFRPVVFTLFRGPAGYPLLLVESGVMAPRASTAIPAASRVAGFVYAIRNIVAEAKKVEAAGRKVRYLNIGDPITFGFRTPPHMIEAVERAMRDGQNGYAPSVGIPSAREAVAAECARRGMQVPADRVVITSGTSEGIELALTALAGPGDEVLDPRPDLSALHRRPREDWCHAGVLPHRPGSRLASRRRSRSQPRHPGDTRARRHRSEQSDRGDVSR